MWCAPTSRCICILLLSVLQCWPDRFPHAITRAMALSRLQRNQFQTGSRPYRWAHSLGITVSLYVSPTSHSTRVCNWLAVIPFPFISGTDEWKTVDAASFSTLELEFGSELAKRVAGGIPFRFRNWMKAKQGHCQAYSRVVPSSSRLRRIQYKMSSRGQVHVNRLRVIASPVWSFDLHLLLLCPSPISLSMHLSCIVLPPSIFMDAS